MSKLQQDLSIVSKAGPTCRALALEEQNFLQIPTARLASPHLYTRSVCLRRRRETSKQSSIPKRECKRARADASWRRWLMSPKRRRVGRGGGGYGGGEGRGGGGGDGGDGGRGGGYGGGGGRGAESSPARVLKRRCRSFDL
jgi:hypothetical protein